MPITATTEVNRSAEAAFAYATDPTHFCEWQKGVVDGRMKGLSTPSVQAQCVTTRRIGFANRPVTLRAHPHRSTQYVGRARYRRAYPGDCRRHR